MCSFEFGANSDSGFIAVVLARCASPGQLSAGPHRVVLISIYSIVMALIQPSILDWIIFTNLTPSNFKLVEHGVFRSSWSLNRAKSTSALS